MLLHIKIIPLHEQEQLLQAPEAIPLPEEQLPYQAETER